ncbi:hypothetical protein [Prolixibacter denitrificans]|uniref:Uncharacterized protein n=1 Tax=Prolixibacter denitrificans TaxID=1541063 RepID=A0A2P8C8P9_9BACT|nr:hypothetical protein [Prolixibacter denitrificans]PSK81340.1 hypothetical protein CLV93_110124 [Prolixibacter denitrificans]GET21575.1 hypothetical protein JCM18694_18210 [Prolixibacter denitrificans]
MTIAEIENTHVDVLTDIKYKHINIWLLLRAKLKFTQLYSETKNNFSIRTKKRKALVKNLFYGFSNLLKIKRFSFIFFSNTNKRYLIENKFYDSYFDSIADNLGQKKSLFIEFADSVHIQKNKVYSTNVISDLPFKIITLLVSKIINPNKIKNLEIIKTILDENKLEINLERELKEQISEYYIYKTLLNILKPKTIFVICYYSKLPLILAAREKKIPVFEVQHGVINKNNEFYCTRFRKLKQYYPSHLISYGDDLLNNPPSDFIYETNKIIPAGNFYLSYIKEHYYNSDLNKLKKKYEKIVCVTSQGVYIDKLMQFVTHLAKSHPKYLFIFRKKYNEDITKYITDNITTLDEYDIYKILKFSDFNITIYSMVALEAHFLNTHNILLNINNLSNTHIPKDISATVVNPDEYLNFKMPVVSEAFSQKSSYFIDNYRKNINELCQKITHTQY